MMQPGSLGPSCQPRSKPSSASSKAKNVDLRLPLLSSQRVQQTPKAFVQQTPKAFVQQTPKAFANCSPGLSQPWGSS